jgi:hypothetical protein
VAARIDAVLRAIELVRYQLAEPAEDGLRPGDLGDFHQTLSPESFHDLGKSGAFRYQRAAAALARAPSGSVLSGEILDLQQ